MALYYTGCPEKNTPFTVIEFLVGITLKIQLKGFFSLVNGCEG